MNQTIEHMSRIPKKNNISLLEVPKKSDAENKIEDHERCHDLKAGFSQSQDFLIDSIASNHMVGSKESLFSLYISKRPRIHMGDKSQILYVGKGSIKFEHGVFKNVLYVPSMAANMFFIYHMTHSVSQKKVTFDSDTMEISEISIRNLIAKGFSNHAFKAYDFFPFIPNSYPSVVLAHANETSRIWHEMFVHLNFKCL